MSNSGAKRLIEYCSAVDPSLITEGYREQKQCSEMTFDNLRVSKNEKRKFEEHVQMTVLHDIVRAKNVVKILEYSNSFSMTHTAWKYIVYGK
jgi:hypothetical protein